MVTATERETVAFSPIDSERFGVRIARAAIVSHSLSSVLDFCIADKVDLLIARCPTNDLVAAQSMEMNGFLLMDTLVRYSFDLTRKEIPEDSGKFLVRRLQPGDEAQVRLIASRAFAGYLGHYHADPRLDRRKCDEGYRSWAERACTVSDAADCVFVAESEEGVEGFATLRRNSTEEVEGGLFAVSPESQGKGMCRSFMIRSLEWSREQGAKRMVISTQVTNIPMQKVWCRVGFEPAYSYYTFHKWFDAEVDVGTGSKRT